MALDLPLQRVLTNLEQSRTAVLDMRREFGRKKSGFLDGYPNKRFERTALTTCEFLLCVLLPAETFATQSLYSEQFAVSKLPAELQGYIADDLCFFVKETTGDNFAAAEPPADFGRPYAYRQARDNFFYTDSVDAAAFFVSTCVLLKQHAQTLLSLPYRDRPLGDWVDKILDLYLSYLDGRRSRWGWYGGGLSHQDADPQLFFTWTATEALVLAAQKGNARALDLMDRFLKSTMRPEIERRVEALVRADIPGQDQDQLIDSSYDLTHLLIIACLLDSPNTVVGPLVNRSFEYWERLQDRMRDPTADFPRQIRVRDNFFIWDVGLLPLYLRGLLLSLARQGLPSSVVDTIQKNIYGLFDMFLKLVPQGPFIARDKDRPDDLVSNPDWHSDLHEFTKVTNWEGWKYLGAEKREGGHPWIFLTERVIEAYCTIAEALLDDSAATSAGVSFSVAFEPNSLAALCEVVKRYLEQQGWRATPIPADGEILRAFGARLETLESGADDDTLHALSRRIEALESRLVKLEEGKKPGLGEPAPELLMHLAALQGTVKTLLGGMLRDMNFRKKPDAESERRIQKLLDDYSRKEEEAKKRGRPISVPIVTEQISNLEQALTQYWDRNDPPFAEWLKTQGIES